MIGSDGDLGELLVPSFQACVALTIYTQDTALKWLGAKFKMERRKYGRREPKEEARQLLSTEG